MATAAILKGPRQWEFVSQDASKSTYIISSLPLQLSMLRQDPSLDPGLSNFTTSLVAVARNVMNPEDIPLLIDLLVQSSSLSSGGVELSRSAYQVRLKCPAVGYTDGVWLSHSRTSCKWGVSSWTSATTPYGWN